MDNTLSPDPSKSQRKREMLAMQKLGETLVKLSEPELIQIPLESPLKEAIDEARRITDHEGKRRQLQYIGKLMRHVDIAPLQEALEKIQRKHQGSKAEFHLIERWREKLIKEKDPALQELMEHYPAIERQYLRQLIRKAHEDRTANKNSGAETEIFRYLKTQITLKK